MEVEAKFAITDALAPEQIDALTLTPYSLRAAGVESHSDILLDTPSRELTQALRGLRVRTIGERRILTLKGPNRSTDGVHEREELEAPLDGPVSYDPREWPPEIGAQVQALTHGDPLAPLLRVQVERRLWAVRRGGRVIGELALDTGEIIAAGRREPVYELELELKGAGARSDLDALTATFLATLPLAPELRSKLQRGLALLRHARWTLDGYTPLDAVGRHVIHRHLRSLLAAQRRVIERGDPDAIHDMRVATRRIRTTLQAFEGAGVFPEKRLRSLHRRFGKIARGLGEIRDTDILLDRVRVWIGPDLERERDLEPLRDLLARRRLSAYERLAGRLGKAKYARLVGDLTAFAREPVAPGEQGCVLTRHYAGSIIWPRYEAILRYETMIADAKPATLHQLRIACKRLRYALEIFAPQLGAGVAPLRKALVAAQGHLGDIQDITVALGLVSRLIQRDPHNAGLHAFAQALQAEHGALMRRVVAVWEPLQGQSLRDALSRALAAL